MRIRRDTKNRRGAGMVEYGLIVGLIAIVAMLSIENTGRRVHDLTNSVSAALADVSNTVDADTLANTDTGGADSPDVRVNAMQIGQSTSVDVGDFRVSCGGWNGNTCTRPQLSYKPSGCREIHDTSFPHYAHTSTRSLEGWCEFATGSPETVSTGLESLDFHHVFYLDDSGDARCTDHPYNRQAVDTPIDHRVTAEFWYREWSSIGTVECAGFQPAE